MFNPVALRPARQHAESIGAYRRRRIAVAEAIKKHMQGTLLWSSQSGPAWREESGNYVHLSPARHGHRSRA